MGGFYSSKRLDFDDMVDAYPLKLIPADEGFLSCELAVRESEVDGLRSTIF